MSAALKHTTARTDFASNDNITCQRCRMFYEDPEETPTPDARVPVMLFPCGCTVCRPCVRAHFHETSLIQQSRPAADAAAAQPQCPLCRTRIEVTKFNDNSLELVRFARQQQMQMQAADQQQQQQQYLAAADGSVLPYTSLNGPLDPKVRMQLQSLCKTADDAVNAEQYARVVAQTRRAIDSCKQDFDACTVERNAAAQSAEQKGLVVSTLQSELKELDAKMAQLQLDRQVLLLQLQSAVEAKSSSSKWLTETDMRMLEQQRKIHQLATELDQRIATVQRLAPGIQGL